LKNEEEPERDYSEQNRARGEKGKIRVAALS
jgi:hypothetical protein